MEKFTAVVLAAGKGVRMRTNSPKVLCDLAGKPLIYYPLKELFSLKNYIKEKFNIQVDIAREKYLKPIYRDSILKETIYV